MRTKFSGQSAYVRLASLREERPVAHGLADCAVAGISCWWSNDGFPGA